MYISTWWTGVRAFFLSFYGLIGGTGDVFGLISLVGLVSLVAGIGMSLRLRVPQAWYMTIVGAAASLSSIAVTMANSVLNWVGMLFAVLVGLIMMLVGTWLVSTIADRRGPIWLLGLAATSLVICSAASAGAFVVLTA